MKTRQKMRSDWVIVIGLILLLMEAPIAIHAAVVAEPPASSTIHQESAIASNVSKSTDDGDDPSAVMTAADASVGEGNDSITAPAEGINEIWAKIRHLHQKVRLKDQEQPASVSTAGEDDYVGDSSAGMEETPASRPNKPQYNGTKPYRIQASGSRAGNNKTGKTTANSATMETTDRPAIKSENMKSMDLTVNNSHNIHKDQFVSKSAISSRSPTRRPTTTTGPPRLENKLLAMSPDDGDDPGRNDDGDGDGELSNGVELYDNSGDPESDDPNAFDDQQDAANKPNLDIVTKFLRIVESQHLLGENCTAGTDFNLGEGVVDRYAQERFRLEAEVAVNRANWLTRLWKYADKSVLHSEYLLHVNLYSMIEMDEDIFAAGNCYDKYVM